MPLSKACRHAAAELTMIRSIYMHTAERMHAAGRVAPTSRAAFERQ